MSCIKEERKGRFLIQEIEDYCYNDYQDDIIEEAEYETEHFQNSNDNNLQIFKKKTKRHFSNNITKFSHTRKSTTLRKESNNIFNNNSNSNKSLINCKVLLITNSLKSCKFIDFNDVWNNFISSKKISKQSFDFKLFKYLPSNKSITNDKFISKSEEEGKQQTSNFNETKALVMNKLSADVLTDITQTEESLILFVNNNNNYLTNYHSNEIIENCQLNFIVTNTTTQNNNNMFNSKKSKSLKVENVSSIQYLPTTNISVSSNVIEF